MIAITMLIAGVTTVNASNTSGLLTTKDLINEKEVTENKAYLWEVVGVYGTAKGSADSLEKAEQMVALFSKKDVVFEYKIVKRISLK